MKKILLLSFLALVLTTQAQKFDPERSPFNKDSVAAKIQRMKDSMNKSLQEVQQENNTRNLVSLMESIEKRRSKEKTKSIIYIVIGVGGLIVLFIGLMRRRTTKK